MINFHLAVSSFKSVRDSTSTILTRPLSHHLTKLLLPRFSSITLAWSIKGICPRCQNNIISLYSLNASRVECVFNSWNAFIHRVYVECFEIHPFSNTYLSDIWAFEWGTFYLDDEIACQVCVERCCKSHKWSFNSMEASSANEKRIERKLKMLLKEWWFWRKYHSFFKFYQKKWN